MKKIIYFLYQPLSKFNYERFGLDTLASKNWDIECWIYLEEFYSTFEKKEIFYKKKKNFYFFKSFFSCLKELRRLPSNFYFVDLSSGSFSSSIIQRLMILKGGKKILFNISLFPVPRNRSLNVFLNNRNFKTFISFIKKVIKIFFKLFNKKFMSPKPDYLFTAGNIPYISAKKKYRKAKIISTHSYDYDTYLNLKNLPINENYTNSIVYIDQAYEENYDIKLNKVNFPASREFHWNSLNLFFNNLNKKFEKKILIAAHHRRDKIANTNTNHEFIFSQTGNLIKNCSLVLAHDSVAISFAILFKKPIVFLITDEIKKSSFFYLSIKKFANELGTEPININQFQSFENYNFLYFDQKAYNRWTDNYIKSPDSKSKFKNFWLDFDNFLEKK